MSLASLDAAGIKPVMVDQLYQQSVSLADESRTYFSQFSKTDRATLGPIDRVLYTAESLRISTRLMHVISWTMVRKAVATGEMSYEDGLCSSRRLDDLELCQASNPRDLRNLPRAVVILTHRSLSLYKRALRLQDQMLAHGVGEDIAETPNPVGSLMRQLEDAI